MILDAGKIFISIFGVNHKLHIHETIPLSAQDGKQPMNREPLETYDTELTKQVVRKVSNFAPLTTCSPPLFGY